MAKKDTVALQDLMGVLFRSSSDELPLKSTHGLWYVFANEEKGIRTKGSTNHSWLRLVGLKVIEKNGIPFDSAVEPIFLRTSHAGEPPNCVLHKSHAHASQSGCVLYWDSYVWLNVDRNMEPNIRDYEKTEKLDRHPNFCTEEDPIFLKSFIFWLSDQGAKYDYSESGI
jgi:hypothetical protein